MKIKTTSTFTLESVEATALGIVVDLLNEMKEECDEYVDSDLTIGDTPFPFSILGETAFFLDYLWSVGSASVFTANYEGDDEQLSFDDFDEGNEDHDGHTDEV